jgi:hypothetical protein
MYSYLLAAARTSELDLYLRNNFGDKWWTEMQPGRAKNHDGTGRKNRFITIFKA